MTAKSETAAAPKFHLLSSDEIIKDQDGIKKDAASLDARVKANALQCIAHCAVHRDTSLMRRLLVDTLTSDSGYRVQGLVVWMRRFSPMELNGKNVNLSGKLTAAGIKSLVEQFPELAALNMKVGDERPFLLEQAEKTNPFKLSREVAIVKVAYRDTLLSPMKRSLKDFREAMKNTKDGKPIDATKPHFEGLHTADVVSFYDMLEEGIKKLEAKPDNTREIARLSEELERAKKAQVA